MGVETDIQSQSLANRRYRQPADSRDLVSAIAVAQNRCATRRCPRLANVGYEQEATFILEDQMGPKLLGFFLYGAISSASNGQSPLPLSAWRAVLAFDNSSQNRGVEASTLPPAYSRHRNQNESVQRYASRSTDRWCNRLLRLLATTSPSAFLSDDRPRDRGAPTSQRTESLVDPFSGRPGTTAPLNSETLLTSAPLRGRCSSPKVTAPWPADAVSPTACDLHWVSYPTIYVLPR